MKEPGAPSSLSRFSEFAENLRSLFNIKADTDEPATIEHIRANIHFQSANAWTLAFAIIIASVGLNTNSTAVIIGAMLISPLMGPIVGAGLALGINDNDLLRRAARNLGFAVLVSLLASTLFFLISPTSEIQSELLARTRPTFYDVLIAVFGGAAGIVAISRREKGNAIPGVAIATALMPPLCTAGFGLATGELQYFFGALYLFIINSVFICISTYIFVRYLGFAPVVSKHRAEQERLDRWIAGIASVIIIPSLVLAWFLQRESSFRGRAASFVKREVRFERTFVIDHEVDYSIKRPKVNVFLTGETLEPSDIAALKDKLKNYGLDPDAVEFRQSSLESVVEERLSAKLQAQSAEASQTMLKLAQTESELKRFKDAQELSRKVTDEVTALFPGVTGVWVVPAMGEEPARAWVRWKRAPAKAERDRLTAFLTKRTDGAAVLLTREL